MFGSVKSLKILLFFGALVDLLATSAFGYGHEGHQAIAEFARSRLSPSARKAVIQLLGNDDLAAIATWPDDLKLAKKHKGPLAGDAEAQAFNESFPYNGQWHFLNLPLGADHYEESGRFSDSDDIVHKINECIAILEAPKGQPTAFQKKQALRFLVHLVGDIHQPLHVGTGYYDLSSAKPMLIEAPDQAYRHNNDEGGNYLNYGNSHFTELHNYWDDTLVEHVAHTGNYRKLALALESRVKASSWTGAGDYHHWADQWATDSVHETRGVYRGIEFLSAERKRNGKLKVVHIRLPENYEETQSGRAADQLAKAGFHLAELLNQIQFKL
jgi:hypothetical protein